MLSTEGVAAREIDGELIIIPITSGIADLEDEIFRLNEIGQVIWNKLDGNRSLSDVARELTSAFEVSLEKAEKDVIGFVEKLLKKKIIIRKIR